MARTPRPLRERRVFVDSSAYLALLDQDDEHHEGATSVLRQLAVGRYRQFTTDAISFVVMERLGITRAFTFDRHFEQYGFTVLTPDTIEEGRP